MATKLEELECLLSLLDHRNKKLTQEKEELEAEKSRVTADLKRAERQLEGIISDDEVAQKRLDSLEKENQRLNALLSSAQQTIDRLRVDLRDAQLRAENFEKVNAIAEQEITRQSEDLRRLAGLEGRLKAAEDALASERDHNDRLQKELIEATQRYAAAEEDALAAARFAGEIAARRAARVISPTALPDTGTGDVQEVVETVGVLHDRAIDDALATPSQPDPLNGLTPSPEVPSWRPPVFDYTSRLGENPPEPSPKNGNTTSELDEVFPVNTADETVSEGEAPPNVELPAPVIDKFPATLRASPSVDDEPLLLKTIEPPPPMDEFFGGVTSAVLRFSVSQFTPVHDIQHQAPVSLALSFPGAPEIQSFPVSSPGSHSVLSVAASITVPFSPLLMVMIATQQCVKVSLKDAATGVIVAAGSVSVRSILSQPPNSPIAIKVLLTRQEEQIATALLKMSVDSPGFPQSLVSRVLNCGSPISPGGAQTKILTAPTVSPVIMTPSGRQDTLSSSSRLRQRHISSIQSVLLNVVVQRLLPSSPKAAEVGGLNASLAVAVVPLSPSEPMRHFMKSQLVVEPTDDIDHVPENALVTSGVVPDRALSADRSSTWEWRWKEQFAFPLSDSLEPLLHESQGLPTDTRPALLTVFLLSADTGEVIAMGALPVGTLEFKTPSSQTVNLRLSSPAQRGVGALELTVGFLETESTDVD